MRKLKNIIVKASGGDLGVPCFVNLDTKDAIVGECSYEELREWATK